jgi:Dyp-type peroxidase family
VSVTRSRYLNSSTRKKLEDRYTREKIRQRGIEFPSPTNQEHIFIVRFDIMNSLSLNRDRDRALVRYGLRDLCRLFDKLDSGIKKIDNLSEDGDINPAPLSEFNFSFTIGFGRGFFEKLNISGKNRPRNLTEMPIHSELGDTIPYSLQQTDFIIQLGADDDYINRWVFQNRTGIIKKNEEPQGHAYHKQLQHGLKHDDEDFPDIYTATSNWAKIIDINAGFQRIDGRNLLGFNDGISNPIRFSNNAIWTTRQDENEKFQNGTYMVFQKIEHDLERWQKMEEETQELWIGRSKGTGLLLGTLSKTEDHKLAADLHSNNNFVRQAAKKKWQRLYDQQKDPERRFFDPIQTQFKGIQIECPVWSHVRKANPRQADGAVKSLIFRRGYLFIDGGLDGMFSSGLLFICFQRNIKNAFENIKKNFLNNKNFPVPQQRKNYNSIEAKQRLQHASLNPAAFSMSKKRVEKYLFDNPDTRNTGKDGLSGPSELGVFPHGLPAVTITLGGGYYFIPPIPKKKISDISEQFFD